MSRKPAVPLTTKKHLARLERERIQGRWILAGTLLTVLVALGLTSYGLIRSEVIEPRQPVAIVDGEKITTQQFRGRVSLYQLDLIQQYRQAEQLRSLFGSDPEFQSYVEQQVAQVQSQLANPEALGQSALDAMIDEVLIRREAMRRGIVVSPEELDDLIAANFGFYPHGTPTPPPTATLSPDTPTPEPPTPTATAGPSPTPAPSATPEPTITPGPSPTPFPTATPYTREAYLADYDAQIEFLGNYGEATEEDYRLRYEAILYRQELLSALKAEVEPEQEQAWARQIVVTDEAAAEALLERLNDGTPWETLENEVTEGEEGSSADLGWFLRGDYPEIEEIAFETPVGQAGGPVITLQGWVIVQVLGREVRPLTETQLQVAAQSLVEEFLSAARSESEIETFDYWSDRVPDPPLILLQSTG
jgi:parvulin-like peptidyl-prolyl isomerase